MKKGFCFAAILAGAIILPPDLYALSLNISPPSFTAAVKPGGSASGKVDVFNKGDIAVGILAYTQDWVYQGDGGKEFRAAGTTPLSCAKWIQLFPQKFEMEPNSTVSVQYSITVPQDAKGGYYAVIFFESVPTGDTADEAGMFIRFAGRLGAIVYLEVEGSTERKAAVESLSIEPPQSNKPLELKLAMKNTGNVYIGAEGVLNIMDDEGLIYGTQKFGPVNTLPGDTREYAAEWFGELEEGSYTAVVTLDIDGAEPLVEERTITVTSGGEITSVSADTSQPNASFKARVKNTGHLNIEAEGRVDIIDKAGAVAASAPLKKVLIAPNTEKELAGLSERVLAPGDYTARAVITVGSKELIKEEAFSVK